MARSLVMAKTNSLHSIGDILGKLVSKAKWNSKLKQYALWQQWGGVVGTRVAKHAQPLRWNGATLVVGVNDSSWLQELRMMESEILEKIKQQLPDLKIAGIHWTLEEIRNPKSKIQNKSKIPNPKF